MNATRCNMGQAVEVKTVLMCKICNLLQTPATPRLSLVIRGPATQVLSNGFTVSAGAPPPKRHVPADKACSTKLGGHVWLRSSEAAVTTVNKSIVRLMCRPPSSTFPYELPTPA
jgi:hypothetical protein